jgi:hypothetical protein
MLSLRFRKKAASHSIRLWVYILGFRSFCLFSCPGFVIHFGSERIIGRLYLIIIVVLRILYALP